MAKLLIRFIGCFAAFCKGTNGDKQQIERRPLMSSLQTTIGREISYTGTGIHTGQSTTITIKPAGPNTGYILCRVDLPGQPLIQAVVDNVMETNRCTTLGGEGVYVKTVEHLLAALQASGIDNAQIDIDGEEVPIADGSAALFCELIESAGTIVYNEPGRRFTLEKPCWVSSGDSHMVALPYPELRISYSFVSDHPVVGNQFMEYTLGKGSFRSEIAPARTVGFAHEIAKMQEAGLAMGGSLNVAVVVGEDRYVNELRFSNEIVRHKVLDIIGDMSLLGQVSAHIIAIKSGHRLNISLAKQMRSNLCLA
ncbi:MAG: UDP-3-O-acyl-N-acetylglucosamine deacetylase [Limnochordia bacterium]|jgi:UDP-3-O-[3-hydroxymyristoyl] N-acetylglucosamine deacetylase